MSFDFKEDIFENSYVPPQKNQKQNRSLTFCNQEIFEPKSTKSKAATYQHNFSVCDEFKDIATPEWLLITVIFC